MSIRRFKLYRRSEPLSLLLHLRLFRLALARLELVVVSDKSVLTLWLHGVALTANFFLTKQGQTELTVVKVVDKTALFEVN